MESLIQTFHIDAVMILAQVTNFAIVFIVLYFLVVKPLQKVMQERQSIIEKSINEAKIIEQKYLDAQNYYKEEIKKAKEEAKKIIEEAVLQAEIKKKQIIDQAQKDVQKIIESQKITLEAEKNKVLFEIKQNISSLVIDILTKILPSKIDEETDNKIIKSIIENIDKK